MKFKVVRKILFLAGTLSTTVLIAFAGDPATYQFLRNDISARAAGLNGTVVSLTNDPNLLFYNPASLTTMSSNRLSAGFVKHLLDVNGGSIAAATDIEGIGKIGVGLIFVDYGSFTKRDADFNSYGEFGARDIAIVGGYGWQVSDNTSLGFGVKAIYSQIEDFRSAAIALDAGILYRLADGRTTIGGSILNLGKQVNAYKDTQEELPLDVRVGISHEPVGLPATVNVQFKKLQMQETDILSRLRAFSVGVEFRMSEKVRLRVGYDNEKRRDLKLGTSSGLAGFAIGAGLMLDSYLFDYSYNSYGKIGGIHRISIGMEI